MLDNAVGCENVIQVSGLVVFLGSGMISHPIAVDNELQDRQ